MLTDTVPKRSANFGLARLPWRILALAAAIIALAAIILLKPRWGLIATSTPAIKLHLACAFSAVVLGTSLMLWKKGRAFHRIGGWVFVALIMTAAIGSLFIRTTGHFSVIHLLSLYTIASVPAGVYFARKHLVYRHRGIMTGLYIGGLIIAGGFTFYPGRLLWQVFFGH